MFGIEDVTKYLTKNEAEHKLHVSGAGERLLLVLW